MWKMLAADSGVSRRRADVWTGIIGRLRTHHEEKKPLVNTPTVSSPRLLPLCLLPALNPPCPIPCACIGIPTIV
eukprot:3031919-Rhodomonas_salina.1